MYKTFPFGTFCSSSKFRERNSKSLGDVFKNLSLNAPTNHIKETQKVFISWKLHSRVLMENLFSWVSIFLAFHADLNRIKSPSAKHLVVIKKETVRVSVIPQQKNENF